MMTLKDLRPSLPSTQGLRVVFDTNVYIAAALKPGMCSELVSRGLQNEFSVFISQEIGDELTSKLTEKFAFPKETLRNYLTLISSNSTLVDLPHIPRVTRDPKDDHVLACALSAKANLIISLDQDLLALVRWEGIPILHPKTLSWIVTEE